MAKLICCYSALLSILLLSFLAFPAVLCTCKSLQNSRNAITIVIAACVMLTNSDVTVTACIGELPGKRRRVKRDVSAGNGPKYT